MSAQGAITFVSHSDLPTARMVGQLSHGEERINEAAVETYIAAQNEQEVFTLERTIRDLERFGTGPLMGRRGRYEEGGEEEDDDLEDDDFEDDDDFDDDDDFEDDDDDDFDEDDDDFDDDEEELFN